MLAFEGIFIDPIGATAALAVTHYALHEHPPGLFRTALTGIVVGLLTAATYAVLVRFARVPESMQVALALALALTAFACGEAAFEESGLWATTTLGVALANQRFVTLDALHEFGSHVGVLIIGSLFILLAARVDLDQLLRYAPTTLLLVGLLVVVLRPVVAFLATSGSVLSRRERGMVGWMAPRGIVAASTASLFALQFEEAGAPFPQLVPVVFGVVLATAVVYGLTGPLVAERLGVRSDTAEPLDADGLPIATAR